MITCYSVYFLVSLNFSKLINKGHSGLIFIISLSGRKDTGQFVGADVVQQSEGLPRRLRALIRGLGKEELHDYMAGMYIHQRGKS